MDFMSLICVSLYVAMVTAAGSAQFPHAEPSVAAVWCLTVVMMASSVVLITVPVVRYFKRAQRELEDRLMAQLKETTEVPAGRKGRKTRKRLYTEMEDLKEISQQVEEEMTRVKEEQEKMRQFYAEREIALKQWMEDELKHSMSAAATKALRDKHPDFEKWIQNSLNVMCSGIKKEVHEGRQTKIDCEKTELQKMSEQFSDLKTHVASLREICGHYNLLVKQIIQKLCRYSRQMRSLENILHHTGISFPDISDDAGFWFKGRTRRRIHERWLIEEAVGTPSGQGQKDRNAIARVMEMVTTMKKRNSDIRELITDLQLERARLNSIRTVAHASVVCTPTDNSAGNDKVHL
ncbi:PREDICTED: uncharacterized protein LOC109467733 [Branchiostoma belcheri]|uniref:Uncharacterized protein LOC109467733 n=1 Tax=Branchiostoma belcheri TaxID=7741 RepID=A0A6P4YA38_BRABE|nr:PREDICTED: uncharacterized protein LOC109467733 [Branchiostoma belcheri]